MSTRTLAAVILTILLLGSHARAQRQQLTQTVQLPTFSFFTVSTTVSVPVSGRGFVGRVHQRSSRSTTGGLPWMSGLPAAARLARSRALSTEASSRGAAVSATVTDLQELDRAVLSAAAARHGTTGHRVPKTDLKALRISRDVSNPSVEASLRLAGSSQSLEEIRRRNALADAKHMAELKMTWKLARAAEAAGRLGAARCGYQLVARKSEGKIRAAALARLAALSPQPKLLAAADRK